MDLTDGARHGARLEDKAELHAVFSWNSGTSISRHIGLFIHQPGTSHELCVMVNCKYQLDWATSCLDIWLTIISVCVCEVVLDEVTI